MVNAWAICIIFGASQLALSAINTQSAASSSMATIIVFGTSCASSACVLRGAPQKVIPYILTKHITASPPVTASITIAIGPASCSATASTRLSENSDCRVYHSLIKPFSGGRADIARQPIRHAAAVHGIRFASAPIFSMSWVCKREIIAPAPRNSSPLNSAWLSR